MRARKDEARRAQTTKLVLGEMAKLEIKSKELLTQVSYLGQPVVKLTEKERALFKKPQVEISDNEISMAAPKADTSEVPGVEAGSVAEAKPPELNAGTEVAIARPAAVDAARTTPIAAPEAPRTAANPEPPKSAPAAVPKPAPAPVTEEPKPLLSLDAPIPDSQKLASLSGAFPAPPMEKSPSSSEKPSDDLPKKDAEDATGGTPASIEGARASGIPSELMPIVQEAKDFFDRGNYREAEKGYEKILAKAPNNLYALSNLGVVRFRSGKLKLAEEAFRKAIAVAPEDAFSHCTLGIVSYSGGKYDEAVNELTKALAINPKNATAHNYLGITASQKGWQEAALKEMETAAALDPQYADAHFNLAVVYATQQPPNKENARRFYKRATELGAEPDSALEALIK